VDATASWKTGFSFLGGAATSAVPTAKWSANAKARPKRDGLKRKSRIAISVAAGSAVTAGLDRRAAGLRRGCGRRCGSGREEGQERRDNKRFHVRLHPWFGRIL